MTKRAEGNDGKPRLLGGPLRRRGGSPLPPMQASMLQKNPDFRKWVKMICRNLYAHYEAKRGGRLSEPERVMLDKLLAELVARRTVEMFLAQGGLLRKDKADQGVLEAHPLIETWARMGHQITRTLLALEQLGGSGPAQGPGLAEILASYTIEDGKDAGEAPDEGAGPGAQDDQDDEGGSE